MNTMYRHVYIVEEIHDRELADEIGLKKGTVLFWDYRGKIYTIEILDHDTGKVTRLATIRYVGKCHENEEKIECARRLGVIK